MAFLVTERDDFEDFHLRVEAQVDTPESDSGVFFRVPSSFRRSTPPGLQTKSTFASIRRDPNTRRGVSSFKRGQKRPGSLLQRAWQSPRSGLSSKSSPAGIMSSPRSTASWPLTPNAPSANRRGHILLQQCGAQTTVRFKKIEIKELPAIRIRRRCRPRSPTRWG